MKQFWDIVRKNANILFVLVSYWIVDSLNVLQPIFREAFKNNPYVSHFFPWFLLQFGFAILLFVMVWKAPFRRATPQGFVIGFVILLTSIFRISLIVGVLSGAFAGNGLKVDVSTLYIFMNRGEYRIDFLGDNYGVPNIMFYSEMALLLFHYIDRTRCLVDDAYRTRYNVKTVHEVLHLRRLQKASRQ